MEVKHKTMTRTFCTFGQLEPCKVRMSACDTLTRNMCVCARCVKCTVRTERNTHTQNGTYTHHTPGTEHTRTHTERNTRNGTERNTHTHTERNGTEHTHTHRTERNTHTERRGPAWQWTLATDGFFAKAGWTLEGQGPEARVRRSESGFRRPESGGPVFLPLSP